MKVKVTKEMTVNPDMGRNALEFMIEDYDYLDGNGNDSIFFCELPKETRIAILYEFGRQVGEAIGKEIENIKREVRLMSF